MAADERSHGLILRTRPLTDTSLIVHWLTPELGRIATVAKGARRPKSPFRGKLDLYFQADFSFHRSSRSELHTLREVVVRETHEALRREIEWLQQAAYCAALIEQTTETETPIAKIFEIFSGLLGHLPKRPPAPITIFAFEMKLLNELGLKPDFAESKLSEGAKKILQSCIDLDWTVLARLKPGDAQNTELRQFLHGFLIFHLGRIPRGRNGTI